MYFLPSILKSSIIINALAVKSKVTVVLGEIFISMQVFFFFRERQGQKKRPVVEKRDFEI